MKLKSVIRRRLMQRRAYQENRKRRTGPNVMRSRIVTREAERKDHFFATLAGIFAGAPAGMKLT